MIIKKPHAASPGTASLTLMTFRPEAKVVRFLPGVTAPFILLSPYNIAIAYESTYLYSTQ